MKFVNTHRSDIVAIFMPAHTWMFFSPHTSKEVGHLIPISVKVRILPSGVEDSLKLYGRLVDAGAAMMNCMLLIEEIGLKSGFLGSHNMDLDNIKKHFRRLKGTKIDEFHIKTTF